MNILGNSATTQHGLAFAWAEGRHVGVYAAGDNEDHANARARALVRFLELPRSETDQRDIRQGFHDSKVSARSDVVNGRATRAAWSLR